MRRHLAAAAAVIAGSLLFASSANAAVIVLKLTGDIANLTEQDNSIPGQIRQSGQLVLSFVGDDDPQFPFVLQDGDEIQAEVTITGGPFIVPANLDMLFGLDFIGGDLFGNITNGKVIVNNDGVERSAGCGNCLNFITEATPAGSPFAITSLVASGIVHLETDQQTAYTVEGMQLTYQSQSTIAVPEPASWALLITGFGGAGAMLRRRRAKDTFVAA